MIIDGARSRGVVSLSPWQRETRVGWRHETRQLAFPWLWITSPEPRRTEFPDLCGTWYSCEKGRKIKIYGAAETERVGEPPPKRVVRTRRRRFSFAVSINWTCTSLLSPSRYWIGRAVSTIDSVTRAMRLSGRVLEYVVVWSFNSIKICVYFNRL